MTDCTNLKLSKLRGQVLFVMKSIPRINNKTNKLTKFLGKFAAEFQKPIKSRNMKGLKKETAKS